MRYAGFWKRFAASLIDSIILMVGAGIIGVILGIAAFASGNEESTALEAVANLVGVVIDWLYAALMESSASQATLGKMALGIKVTDLDGNRIGFGKATGRHFGKIISALMLLVGYLMAAFTARKQALHDIMAGCLVVEK